MAQAILTVRPSQTPPELDQIGPALRGGGLGPLTLSDSWVRRLARCPASPGAVFRVRRATIRQQN
ncbi:hypothetical protein [Luteithermobacter gelatinilyticus]|uniref:hypothetical protein n=1 Tax=Luteithermobacter gelatinilyticus TaxID=2582913 RepID=UPI00110598E2|nr:hypothetical protein [Luteithermobacter gelatinilyticus]